MGTSARVLLKCVGKCVARVLEGGDKLLVFVTLTSGGHTAV